jgi:hypothetical protein
MKSAATAAPGINLTKLTGGPVSDADVLEMVRVAGDGWGGEQ